MIWIDAITKMAAVTTTNCDIKHTSFFNFPTWYKYLPRTQDAQGNCIPAAPALNDAWLILAAVIEMLLRIAAMVAIGFVIYGGISYILSQGEPDATTRARNTIVNALVGLAIAVLAAAIVTFIAGRIS